ncbi:MAG: hypothetical protein LBI69_02375 [Puniceicoccales bacterium]|nr:hypothetical protein [Puniceicoccales bacterium]
MIYSSRNFLPSANNTNLPPQNGATNASIQCASPIDAGTNFGGINPMKEIFVPAVLTSTIKGMKINTSPGKINDLTNKITKLCTTKLNKLFNKKTSGIIPLILSAVNLFSAKEVSKLNAIGQFVKSGFCTGKFAVKEIENLHFGETPPLDGRLDDFEKSTCKFLWNNGHTANEADAKILAKAVRLCILLIYNPTLKATIANEIANDICARCYSSSTKCYGVDCALNFINEIKSKLNIFSFINANINQIRGLMKESNIINSDANMIERKLNEAAKTFQKSLDEFIKILEQKACSNLDKTGPEDPGIDPVEEKNVENIEGIEGILSSPVDGEKIVNFPRWLKSILFGAFFGMTVAVLSIGIMWIIPGIAVALPLVICIGIGCAIISASICEHFPFLM